MATLKTQYKNFLLENPKEKDFNIGGTTTFNEMVKKELDKCILVCANCHSEIHDNNLRSDARVVK